MVYKAPDVPSGRITGPIFAGRKQAGRQLADRRLRFKDQQPVVLGLSRGGVPVGFRVANQLGAPFDLVLVRKVGVPFQPELAYGAVVDGDHPEIVINQEVERLLHLSRCPVSAPMR